MQRMIPALLLPFFLSAVLSGQAVSRKSATQPVTGRSMPAGENESAEVLDCLGPVDGLINIHSPPAEILALIPFINVERPVISVLEGHSPAVAAANAAIRAESLARRQADLKSEDWMKRARAAEAAHLNPLNATAVDPQENISERASEITRVYEKAMNEARQAIALREFVIAELALQKAQLVAWADCAIFRQEKLRQFNQGIAEMRQTLANEQTRSIPHERQN